ncbi:MAG: glutamate racemase, partial [Candidatus Gracilibacteria bacterium]|nr:glutamate racemase [Candidatus Gracilibacteria bacterium]
IPLIVVTAGSQTLQTQKIKLLGFDFDEVYITNPLLGKASSIQKILEKYPHQQIIYTDDKVSELQKISEALPLPTDRLQLYCISHGDRPPETPHTFQTISSITDTYKTSKTGGNSRENQVPQGNVANATENKEAQIGTRSSHVLEVSKGKLGFFDSGIGGLTVMKEFQKLYPDLDTEYFGDSKNCPYGDRNPEEILKLVTEGVNELVMAGCTIVILACNTAVAHAVRHLQQETYPLGSHVKILGVTLPGAEQVVELGLRHVGVLATQATVNNRAYQDRVHVLDPTIVVQEIAIPGLVNLIEAEKKDVGAIEILLQKAIVQFDSQIEALVLGCTHYPLVADEIQAIWEATHGKKILLIDPGFEAAVRFGDYLNRHPEFELSRGGTNRIHITK